METDREETGIPLLLSESVNMGIDITVLTIRFCCLEQVWTRPQWS